MKQIIPITIGVLLVFAASDLIAWPSSQVDEGQAKREKADRIMSQIYGPDWMVRYEASVLIHSPDRTMAADYKRAIGYRAAR